MLVGHQSPRRLGDVVVISLNCLRYFKRLGGHQERSSVTAAIGTIPSKFWVACLKRARLWSAFGKVERTRVSDVLVNLAQVRLLHRIMGKPSVEDELNGIDSELIGTKKWRPERNFRRALQKAEIAYLLTFDPDYLERQEIWQKARFAGLVNLSHPWSSGNALADER